VGQYRFSHGAEGYSRSTIFNTLIARLSLRSGVPAHVSLMVSRVLAASLLLVVALAGCNSSETEDRASTGEMAPVIATASIAGKVTSGVVAQPTATVEVATSISATPTAQPSTTLVLPVEATYTVREGDTLGQIALQFDTSVEALMQANNLTSSELIFVGQTLKIVRISRDSAVAGGATVPATAPLAVPTDAPPAASVPPTEAPLATPMSVQPAEPEMRPTPVVVNGRTYDAYNQAAIKKGQWYQYTCEFDAAWVVLKTYGFDVPLEKQVEIVGLDTSIEPYYEETADGLVIYGGDVTKAYSGDYKTNFLARSSGQAMRKVFEYYGLRVTVVRDRPSLEAALLRGELVWIKTTVDFKPWREVTWIMPDGRSYKTVLGNDHALVVMGFNKEGVVVRDPLGPTSTGRQRPYEYTVTWQKFMASWGAQVFDGLAVAPPH